jgi:hypothetical protein
MDEAAEFSKKGLQLNTEAITHILIYCKATIINK